MRGLDNFAASGSQAFDDIKNVVRVLGQLGKGHECSEKMTGMLNEGKQYLKVQQKVLLTFQMKSWICVDSFNYGILITYKDKCEVVLTTCKGFLNFHNFCLCILIYE